MLISKLNLLHAASTGGLVILIDCIQLLPSATSEFKRAEISTRSKRSFRLPSQVRRRAGVRLRFVPRVKWRAVSALQLGGQRRWRTMAHQRKLKGKNKRQSGRPPLSPQDYEKFGKIRHRS